MKFKNSYRIIYTERRKQFVFKFVDTYLWKVNRELFVRKYVSMNISDQKASRIKANKREGQIRRVTLNISKIIYDQKIWNWNIFDVLATLQAFPDPTNPYLWIILINSLTVLRDVMWWTTNQLVGEDYFYRIGNRHLRGTPQKYPTYLHIAKTFEPPLWDISLNFHKFYECVSYRQDALVHEQRAFLYRCLYSVRHILFKLEKSCVETIELKTAFGDECIDYTLIKEGRKRFKDSITHLLIATHAVGGLRQQKR